MREHTRSRQTSFRLVLLLCLSLGAGLGAASTARSAEPAAALHGMAPLPEEIVVTGRDIEDLRAALSEAEDLMYAIFNALNDDDLYDIHCRREAPLGTRLKSKVCRPRYQLDAEAGEGQHFLQGGVLPPPVQAVLQQHAPILEQKMKDILLTHPEFYEAVVKQHSLREALDERGRVSLDD